MARNTEESCNICGCDSFGAGPLGRMSANSLPPRCNRCQSLERHRLIRNIFVVLKDNDFTEWSVLQFSSDLSVVPGWFRSHEVSIFGGVNSLDVQKIDRESDSYDLVVCNHVIEHVQYDNAALTELSRVAKSSGIVFLSFPDPAHRRTTVDWGRANEAQHGHYRVYGQDVDDLFRRYLPHCYVLKIKSADPVTGSDDIVFFVCNSSDGVARVVAKLPNVTILNQPQQRESDIVPLAVG